MKEPFIYLNPARRNNALILVQAHGAVERALVRHWPWLMKSGCDIMATSPEDDPLKGVRGPLLGKVIAGDASNLYRLQERAVMAFEMCLERLQLRYSSVMLLHYDCVFLGAVPMRVPKGLETFRYRSSYKQFKADWKCGPPWWFSWEALEKFTAGAKARPVDYEQGYLDHWIPAICEEFNVPVVQTDLISYSCSSLTEPSRVEAEESIRTGHPLVHGVKSVEDLKWVLGVRRRYWK